MLDNLKLGFGGTKEEMQRLLDEAEKLSGIHYDIGNYADIVNAIHVIQTEMDITGTTAKEAEGTISGSIAAFKSSVSNLLAGMGDANADVDQLTDNVVEAFKTMAGNIIPILQNIWDHLPGGAKFALIAMGAAAAISPVAGAISNIAGAVSGLMKILPALASPVGLVVAAIVAAIVAIAIWGDEIQAALQKLDDWLQGVFARDWTELFGPVLGEQLNGFFASVKNIWDSIKQVFDGIIDFIRGVFTGDWQRAWEGVKEIFLGTFNALASRAKVPLNGVIALLNGAINGINMMIDALNGLHFTIPDWVPLLGGKEFGLNLKHVGSIPYLASGGILSSGSAVVGEAGPELLTLTGGKAVVQPLSGNGPSLKGVEGLLGGISDKLGAGQPVTIVVQSVLDGRVIGETAYDYTMQRARARG